jgi:1,4-alpha-glucan branching enzyme
MIKKEFLKSKDVCKVTFSLPPDTEQAISSIEVLGDFNNWITGKGTMMKKQKDKSFKVTMSFEKGKEYEFRYLINSSIWSNEENADKQVPTPYGSENSVLVTSPEN